MSNETSSEAKTSSILYSPAVSDGAGGCVQRGSSVGPLQPFEVELRDGDLLAATACATTVPQGSTIMGGRGCRLCHALPPARGREYARFSIARARRRLPSVLPRSSVKAEGRRGPGRRDESALGRALERGRRSNRKADACEACVGDDDRVARSDALGLLQMLEPGEVDVEEMDLPVEPQQRSVSPGTDVLWTRRSPTIRSEGFRAAA